MRKAFLAAAVLALAACQDFSAPTTPVVSSAPTALDQTTPRPGHHIVLFRPGVLDVHAQVVIPDKEAVRDVNAPKPMPMILGRLSRLQLSVRCHPGWLRPKMISTMPYPTLSKITIHSARLYCGVTWLRRSAA